MRALSQDFGSWTNNSGDDIDWTRQSGGTPSANTGPSTASNGTFYLFTEASGSYNTQALLDLDFDFTGISNPSLSFDYHMYGADMGYINIIANGQIIWTKSGQEQTANGDGWTTTVVDLSDFGGSCFVNLQISGTTGSNYRSDMSVDNIVVDFSDATWTGTASTDWNNSANWSTGNVPSTITNVTIPDVSGASGNFPVLASGANGTCFELTVDASASLTVNSGMTLSIAGNYTNNGVSSIGAGLFKFTGTSGQAVSGNIAFTDLEVDNSSSGVTYPD